MTDRYEKQKRLSKRREKKNLKRLGLRKARISKRRRTHSGLHQ